MRRSRTILIAVVAILAIVALGLMVAQDQETRRVRSAHTADDPRFVQYIAALAGGSFTRGDTYRVLTNGDEVFPAMLDAITRARRRISFESDNYSTGQVATDFTRELAAAARRGVEVRVLIDAIGASDMSDEDKQTLESAGCRVVAYNPTRWYSLENVNPETRRAAIERQDGGLHRALVSAVDRCTTLTSSTTATGDSAQDTITPQSAAVGGRV